MMNQNETELPSIFKSPVASGPLDLRTRLSPIEFKQSFVNNLAMPVTLYWRNGMKFVLPSETSAVNSTLVIRIAMTVKPSGYQSVMAFLATVNNQSTPELQAIQDAFYQQIKVNSYTGGEVVLDYPVTLRELKDIGGAAYYSEVDTVISILSDDSWICHPYSEEGRDRDVLAKSFVKDQACGFGYSITMIDNGRQYGMRYININREVYKVKPTVDLRKQDGIYIVSNHSVSNANGNDGFETRHFPLEGAEETVGLWRTYEEALHSGDLSAASKKELASLEHSLHKAQIEKQEATQQYQLQLLEKEKEAKEVAIRHEQEKMDMEKKRAALEFEEKQRREALKDQYEHRSYVRKDTSEGLKFLPTLIVGLGALAALFLKSK